MHGYPRLKLSINSLTPDIHQSHSGKHPRIGSTKLTRRTSSDMLSSIRNLMQVQTDRTQLETERKKLDKAKKLFEHEKASKTTLKGADRDRHVEALEEEVKGLKEFAKCTVCKKHYRTHILTTCMHTFCKQCVDDRISARERRCMTCPTKFSAADVKQIW
ncbi:hypothetical protein DL96DRAFT_1188116 [Flagelloscypha sp. PMI_526]|nr:hypothetical protein DL96DRAFT_1188116 [Flagelloscypha sp. PMI_526]